MQKKEEVSQLISTKLFEFKRKIRLNQKLERSEYINIISTFCDELVELGMDLNEAKKQIYTAAISVLENKHTNMSLQIFAELIIDLQRSLINLSLPTQPDLILPEEKK